MAGFLATTTACAPKARPTKQPDVVAGQAVTDAARRIYWLAEAQYEQGNYPAAVGLWTHALLQLPQTVSADVVRHQLVLRLAYGRLAASESSGTPPHAEAGIAMLERYLAKHEMLFGDGADAQAQRSNVYELLYELESQLASVEDPPRDEEPALEVPDDDEPAPVPQQTTVAASPAAEAEEAAPTPQPPDNADADADADADYVRTVHVTTPPRVDSVRARAALESVFSDSTEGLAMTQPGIVSLHGPRPLLRVRSVTWASPTKRSERPRGTTRAIINRARPMLLSCYVAALGRGGKHTVRVGLTLRTVDGGAIRAQIRDGMLVDSWGDVCVAQAFSTLEANTDLAGTPDLNVDLLFFVEGELFVREWNGRALRDELDLVADALTGVRKPKPTAPTRALPPIDAFVH